MKYTPHILTFMLLFFAGIPGFSQTDSTGSAMKIKLGTYYNSNLNYYGRVDSISSSGFFPLAEIWWKDRFYINAAPVFTSSNFSNLNYAGTVLTAGIQTLNEKKSFYSNIIFTVPIYKKDAALVQSALKAQGTVNIAFMNNLANLNVGGDVKFSEEFDYGANAGIDHPFKIPIAKKLLLIIDPSFYCYAGTQRFTESHYIKKQSFILFPETTEEVKQQVKRFEILAYEASVPLIVVKRKWQLLVNSSYIIPQNLLKTSTALQTTEIGKNLFYIVAGIKYSL